METIGQRLAFARKDMKYTQDALAEAICVSRGVIVNIELGRAEPQPVVLNAICRQLNISSEWLQFGRGKMKPDNERSKILNELFLICSTLTESEQLFLLDTIKAMQKHITQKDS